MGGGGGGGGILGSLFGFAKGGVFAGGAELTAFAQGGVVNRPTLFPFAKGVGLMGEAGPEAILPLRRGKGGRLGVEMSGDGAAPLLHRCRRASSTSSTRPSSAITSPPPRANAPS